MKQYSIYFSEPGLSSKRTEITIETKEGTETLKLSQPGVLIIDETILSERFVDIAKFGIEKIVCSGDIQPGLVIEKKPKEKPVEVEPVAKVSRVKP